jgi:hypothetical protein
MDSGPAPDGASRNDGDEDLARDDGATYRIRGGFFANATAIAEINGFMK